MSGQWQNLPSELLLKILEPYPRAIVTSTGVCHAWRAAICAHVNALSFSWCARSVTALVTSIIPRFRRLRRLSLQRCSYLEDAALQIVAGHCPELEYLEVSTAVKLTEASLRALAGTCLQLRVSSVFFRAENERRRRQTLLSITCLFIS